MSERLEAAKHRYQSASARLAEVTDGGPTGRRLEVAQAEHTAAVVHLFLTGLDEYTAALIHDREIARHRSQEADQRSAAADERSKREARWMRFLTLAIALSTLIYTVATVVQTVTTLSSHGPTLPSILPLSR
ncbi:MAG TPA: hypothetical protein VHG72_22040 [Polyangia bacterium]|nr:hypothetical protein [Polyangia bacterium]